MHNDDETIDLLGYLSRLKRFWLPALVVGLVVAAVVAGLGWKGDRKTDPTYHAKAHVMVQLSSSTPAQADLQAQMAPQLMRTFVALYQVPVLTDSISKKLNGRYTPDQVAQMTGIYWGGGSQLLAMQAQAPTEQDALDLSNAAADALVEHGADVVKLPKGDMPRLVKVQDAIPDPAFPQPDTSTSVAKPIESGLGTGIVAAILTALVLEWRAAARARRRVTAAR